MHQAGDMDAFDLHPGHLGAFGLCIHVTSLMHACIVLDFNHACYTTAA